MVIISSILGALLVGIANYITVSIVEKKRNFIIPVKKKIICDIITFFVTLILGILYLTKLNMLEIMLQYIFIFGMSVFAIIDYEQHFIPNRMLLILLLIWAGITGIAVIMSTEYGLSLFFSSLIGGIVGGLIFALCYVLTKGQLGAGDVKLVFIMGLYLTGERIIGAIFYGVVLCLLYSLVQMIRKKIGLKDGVPLAPFLYLGTLITYFILS